MFCKLGWQNMFAVNLYQCNIMHSNYTLNSHSPQPHSQTTNSFPNSQQPKQTRVCNYIRQYFAVDQTCTIPQISIANFYQKIHKLRAALLQPNTNLFQFMQTSYPFQPLLSLNSQLCNQHLQAQQRINQTNTSDFTIIEDREQQLKSLYFGRIIHQRKQGYAVYAEYNLQESGKFNLVYFYEGFFQHNQKQGFGIQWNQRRIYIGNFNHNQSLTHQSSIFLYETGDIYVGSVRDGKKDGKGGFFKPKKKLNQHFRYQTSGRALDYEYVVVGIWQDDEIVIKNDYLMKTGMNELLQMNLFNVQTNLLIQDHSIFCGNLLQKQSISLGQEVCFVRSGKGLQYFSNGDIYRGDYIQDKPHGSGHYYWSTCEEYVGEFHSGLRSGNGRWVGSNGQQFEGEYKNDKRNGYGIYKWPNGDVYEGEFYEDVRNGVGKMSWSNGQKYVGHWKNGLQHGTGQIQVQLRCTSLHKKFLFHRGNPVLKQEEDSTQAQCDNLMKSKFQYKHKIKEIKEQKLSQHKRDDRNYNSESKTMQNMRKQSLGQLKLSKRIKMQQYERARRLKTQHKPAFQIDPSFLQFRNRQSNFDLAQTHKKTKTNMQKDKPFFNSQDTNNLAYTQDKTANQDYEVMRRSEPMQTQTQFKGYTIGEQSANKKITIKKKLLKQRRKTEQDLKLGDTLMKPIKWVNFKQSWERA